jgi:hypothetical protein
MIFFVCETNAKLLAAYAFGSEPPWHRNDRKLCTCSVQVGQQQVLAFLDLDSHQFLINIVFPRNTLVFLYSF